LIVLVSTVLAPRTRQMLVLSLLLRISITLFGRCFLSEF
jgi:hypothetical protein